MTKFFLGLLFFSLIAVPSLAECNFKTGKWIKKLQSPQYLQSIEVKVDKRRKFAKNAFQIVASSEANIQARYKKKFTALVVLNYPFGSCQFPAKVRQSGDWKDHIWLNKHGKIIQSLNVNLKLGNVLNSVSFKLLIPRTRGNLKEVFATSLLTALDFIAPETFEVSVNVNGVVSKMLFQENAQKELLERRKRREGPIFEGDETLLWGAGRISNDDIALTRLINDKWFAGGKSSAHITLKAYKKLQQAYMLNSNNKMGQFLDPNLFILEIHKNSKLIFPKYHLVMMSLDAGHGLYPHNRKFFYNSFLNSFEPIYYDGSVLNGKISQKLFTQVSYEDLSERLDVLEYIKNITSKKIKSLTLKSFQQRTNLSAMESEKVFEKYWELFIFNLGELNTNVKENKNLTTNSFLLEDEYKKFVLKFSKKLETDLIGLKITPSEDSRDFIVRFHNKKEMLLSLDEVSELISSNRLGKQRATLLEIGNEDASNTSLKRSFLGGSLVSSPSLKININKTKRQIIFIQTTSEDWAYIYNADISNWNLKFQGIVSGSTKKSQRFNSDGMTGCLNLFKSNFNGAKISVTDGVCEDSLNIVDSTGNLSEVIVERAYSDAVDFDFSNLTLDKIFVNKAGNDCLDISGGVYTFGQSSLKNCSDKGISVGEASILDGTDLNVEYANIGVSSKDFSSVNIENAVMDNIKICAEAMQKKQEFGGAILILQRLKCNGFNIFDAHSVLKADNL